MSERRGPDSPVAEHRRLLQVSSPWPHGITLPLLECVDHVKLPKPDSGYSLEITRFLAGLSQAITPIMMSE
jgi:hypothetical protein